MGRRSFPVATQHKEPCANKVSTGSLIEDLMLLRNIRMGTCAIFPHDLFAMMCCFAIYSKRKKRFELSTLALARLHSTIKLLPLLWCFLRENTVLSLCFSRLNELSLDPFE